MVYIQVQELGSNLKVKDIKRSFFKQDYQINKRMKLKLQRGLIRPETKIDLHGKTLSEAKKSLSHFIKSSINNNIRCILVITGKKKTFRKWPFSHPKREQNGPKKIVIR